MNKMIKRVRGEKDPHNQEREVTEILMLTATAGKRSPEPASVCGWFLPQYFRLVRWGKKKPTL